MLLLLRRAARLSLYREACGLASLHAAGQSDQTVTISSAPCIALHRTVAHAPCLESMAWTTPHIRTFASSSSSAPAPPPPPPGGGEPSTQAGTGEAAPPPGALRHSLQDAVRRLSAAAVAKVEAGDIDTAVSILQEGIDGFGPKFPGR